MVRYMIALCAMLTISIIGLSCFEKRISDEKLTKLRPAALPPSPYKDVRTQVGLCTVWMAIPEHWNGDLAIEAHGAVPIHSRLSPDVFTNDDPWFREYMDAGWIVASTSFRSRLCSIDESAEDMDDLRQYITDTYGQPKRVFLIGWSRGGGVVIRMAETRNGLYTAAIAYGPVIVDPTYKPKIPVFIMTTEDEKEAPLQYVQKSIQNKFRAVCWHTGRSGHCDLSQIEILMSWRAMIFWSEGGVIGSERKVTIDDSVQ